MDAARFLSRSVIFLLGSYLHEVYEGPANMIGSERLPEEEECIITEGFWNFS